VGGRAFSYRKPASGGPVRAAHKHIVPARVAAWRVQHRWQTQAVLSPASRQPQAHGRGWDWTPRDGLSVRPDRMPGWVRLWHKTPFADRHACNWMW
jgi:hypothetical protein